MLYLYLGLSIYMPHHTQETSPVLKHAGLDAVAAPANPRAHRVSVLVVQGGNNRGRTQIQAIRAGADVSMLKDQL